MNVAASASAHFGHSAFAVFAGNGPTLAMLVVTGKVGLLAVRTACQMYFLTNCEAIDED